LLFITNTTGFEGQYLQEKEEEDQNKEQESVFSLIDLLVITYSYIYIECILLTEFLILLGIFFTNGIG